LLSFAIVKDIDEELWKECVAHEPLVVSNAGIQYYDILSFILKEHNNFKLESMTKKAMKQQFESKDQLANLNSFLSEFERKKAGITYDKAIFDAGFQVFMREYELQLEKSQLEIYCEKLAKLSTNKASLVMIWGQPEEFAKREFYFDYMIPRLNLQWCEKFMKESYKNDLDKVQGISGLLKTEMKPDSVYSLGKKYGIIRNGSRLFLSMENEPENLLTSIRNYYRGQNIVLNIWSTWCGPCINDMQRSRYISADLDKLPLRFVHLCIDDNTSVENWKEKVIQLQVKGDHIFLNKKLSAEIMSYFDFYSFPNYIFIDHAGNYDPYLIDAISRIDTSTIDFAKSN
jgi:thiol-disulfide isomerase/thioredoxin